jgi:hypothetical protein
MPDDRVTCTVCANLRGGLCVNARQAGLHERNNRAEISRTLAAMLQRCPGFAKRVVKP